MTSDQTMRALADAATPGPWEEMGHAIEQKNWNETFPEDPVSCDVDCMAYCYGGTGKGVSRPEDAEFIAACREWVPDAIRRIEAVRELHRADVSVGIHAHVCTECRQEYPCPTIRALDGDK